jgi:hypothetical protein
MRCGGCGRRPSNPARSVPVAVGALGGLLREAPARALFAKSGGVPLLAPLLRAGGAGGPAAPNSQLLYEAGLCVWQLSFYTPAAAAMGAAGVLPGLVELARGAAKEKVQRPWRGAERFAGACGRAAHCVLRQQALHVDAGGDLAAALAGRWVPTSCPAPSPVCEAGYLGTLCENVAEPWLTLGEDMAWRWERAAAQVVRVALLALRNLLAAPGLELGPELVELGLPKVVQQRLLQARRAPLSPRQQGPAAPRACRAAAA